jgi:catechol 2,3-dioxygenase-like lactoylglutathione lyase family enzyme
MRPLFGSTVRDIVRAASGFPHGEGLAMDEERHDLGWTHVALPAHDLDASIAFYASYAGLRVVHDRTHGGDRVVWLTDGRRPFVLVLVSTAVPVARPLGPFAHLGIAVERRADVDTIAARARSEERLAFGPEDYGPPVGYLCYVRDPDGHNVEFSYGQDVGLAVNAARDERARRDVGSR